MKLRRMGEITLLGITQKDSNSLPKPNKAKLNQPAITLRGSIFVPLYNLFGSNKNFV